MYSAYSGHILEFIKVKFGYDRGRPFIREMTFSVDNGEFVGLLGANGSGKSTILKMAGGILTEAGGTIQLWGKPLRRYRNRDRAKLVSYLPQILDLHIPFTVRDIVSMGLYPYDIPPSLTVNEAIDIVGLRERADSPVTTLSGGERRRVYIAMTLVQGAGLVLLDEPLANLDVKYQVELMKLMGSLREQRSMTVVMALHDINLALQFDRIILVKEGEILGNGTPREVLTEELIRSAFDVDVVIERDQKGGALYLRF